jgi:hypothetical protein
VNEGSPTSDSRYTRGAGLDENNRLGRKSGHAIWQDARATMRAVTIHAIWLLLHALATVVFVNRYLGGFLVRLWRGKNWGNRSRALTFAAIGSE